MGGFMLFCGWELDCGCCWNKRIKVCCCCWYAAVELEELLCCLTCMLDELIWLDFIIWAAEDSEIMRKSPKKASISIKKKKITGLFWPFSALFWDFWWQQKVGSFWENKEVEIRAYDPISHQTCFWRECFGYLDGKKSCYTLIAEIIQFPPEDFTFPQSLFMTNLFTVF